MRFSHTRNFLLFTCFLVIGYSASAHLYTSQHRGAASAFGTMYTSGQNQVQSLKNGQRSLLLIGVDSKDTLKPQLQSLWLLTYLPSNSTLTFLPIFPSGDPVPSDAERKIRDAFSLERVFDIQAKAFRPVPGAAFTRVMEQHNYWWSGYFIYDKAGADQILNLLGFKQDPKQNGQAALPDWSDPENSFTAQLMLLQAACQRFTEVSAVAYDGELLTRISDYFVTNINPAQMLQEWETLVSNGEQPLCSFPTLQVSRVNH